MDRLQAGVLRGSELQELAAVLELAASALRAIAECEEDCSVPDGDVAVLPSGRAHPEIAVMTGEPEIVEDAGEVVDRVWPYDGPHGPERVAEAARATGLLVRYLNNATGPGNASRTLLNAASAARVIGVLGGTVGLLPQLLGQLCGFFERQDPTLYDDRRDRSGSVTAAELVERLWVAHRTVIVLGEQLAEAARLSSHLGNDIEDVEEDR